MSPFRQSYADRYEARQVGQRDIAHSWREYDEWLARLSLGQRVTSPAGAYQSSPPSPFVGFALPDFEKTSWLDGSCCLRHCAGVMPRWLLKAR
jgi:hypothetical protein